MAELPKGGGLWVAWGESGGWGWEFSRYLWHLSLGRVAVGFLRHDVDMLVGKGLEQVDPLVPSLAASPSETLVQEPPTCMAVDFERFPTCFWHICPEAGNRGEPCAQVRHEPDHTVLRCVTCGMEGRLPVGTRPGRLYLELEPVVEGGEEG